MGLLTLRIIRQNKMKVNLIENLLLGCSVEIDKQSLAAKLLEDWSKKEKHQRNMKTHL